MKEERSDFFKKVAPLILSLYSIFLLFFFFKDAFPKIDFFQDLLSININQELVISIILSIFLISFSFYILYKKKLIPRTREDAFLVRKITESEDKLNNERSKRLNTQREIKKLKSELDKFMQIVKSKRSTEFLITSLEDRSYRERIENCIDKAKSLKVIGPYWNNELVNKFIQKADKCDIMVISTPEKHKHGDRFHNPAIKELKRCLQKRMRSNGSIHSRLMICNDEEIICGSADFNSFSLSGDKMEAGIWTIDPIVVQSAMKFFDDTWNKSKG